MQAFINEPLGLLHFLSAIVALISGLIVLIINKGTNRHKTVGYVYFISMLIVNISAIPITNMTGSIGIFHVFILMSLPTLLLAMYYPIFARKRDNWVQSHFTYMYWSYIGLFAAFVAEVMIRLPILSAVSEKVSQASSMNDTSTVSAISAFAVLAIIMLFAEVIFRKMRTNLFHKFG